MPFSFVTEGDWNAYLDEADMMENFVEGNGGTCSSVCLHLLNSKGFGPDMDQCSYAKSLKNVAKAFTDR